MKEQNIKRLLSAFVIVLIAFTAVSIWVFYPRPAIISNEPFSDDFEHGLTNWVIGYEVPNNSSGQPVEWTIELSTNQSVSPTHSVLFAIDGTQDDGAIWIQHKLNLAPNTQKNVNVTFQLWSPSESFNTIAVVIGYIGEEAPRGEGSFEVLGAANQVEGWKTYSYSTDITADGNGNAYVALGIAVTWETEMAYFVDNAQITVN